MNRPKHTAKLNTQNHFSTLALRATALGDPSMALRVLPSLSPWCEVGTPVAENQHALPLTLDRVRIQPPTGAIAVVRKQGLSTAVGSTGVVGRRISTRLPLDDVVRNCEPRAFT